MIKFIENEAAEKVTEISVKVCALSLSLSLFCETTIAKQRKTTSCFQPLGSVLFRAVCTEYFISPPPLSSFPIPPFPIPRFCFLQAQEEFDREVARLVKEEERKIVAMYERKEKNLETQKRM